MLGGRMATRCNVLKTAGACGNITNFGAIFQSTSRSRNMGSTSANADEKENIHRGQVEGDFIPRNVLKERINVISNENNVGTDTPKVEPEVIRQMLKTEEHHVIDVIKDAQGNLKDVFWCPVYLRPDVKGQARGGDEIPHHMCKTCGRIGLHLLNDGKKYRPCLGCAGWSETEIPLWYYHVWCRHCEHALKH